MDERHCRVARSSGARQVCAHACRQRRRPGRLAAPFRRRFAGAGAATRRPKEDPAGACRDSRRGPDYTDVASGKARHRLANGARTPTNHGDVLRRGRLDGARRAGGCGGPALARARLPASVRRGDRASRGSTWPSTSAMACSPISAIRSRTRMTRCALSGPVWRSSRACQGSVPACARSMESARDPHRHPYRPGRRGGNGCGRNTRAARDRRDAQRGCADSGAGRPRHDRGQRRNVAPGRRLLHGTAARAPGVEGSEPGHAGLSDYRADRGGQSLRGVASPAR